MGHTSILDEKDAKPPKAKTPKELQFLRGYDKLPGSNMSKNTFAFYWLQVNSSMFRLQLTTHSGKVPRAFDEASGFFSFYTASLFGSGEDA